MPAWTLAAIAQHTHGSLLQGESAARVQGISTDSRTVQDGQLFLALRGDHFDGHQFLAMALARGATALLISEAGALSQALSTRDGAAPAIIQVPDTQQALQDLALAHRQQFAGTIVAITGSSGKTTVKEMTAAVLQTRLRTLKSPGNLNNHLGVPLALLGLEDTHQVAVLEMGMNHLGEIQRLCDIALPHIGVITNIGLAHVGHLGSIERVQQAKGELIDSLDVASVAIVNADDPRALALGMRAPGRVMTFGQSPEADIRGWIHEDRGLQGTQCVLQLHEHPWHVTLAVPGAHQLMNALAAAAVGVALELDPEEIVAGLHTYRGMYGRMHVRHGQHGVTLIDDTYNANPQSMQAALHCLAHTPVAGQRVAVLGDMLELGVTAPALHEDIGTLVAQSAIDQLITVGPLAHHIAHGAQRAGMMTRHIHAIPTQEEALAVLQALVRPGDVILLKGSRGMALERLVQALAAEEGTG